MRRLMTPQFDFPLGDFEASRQHHVEARRLLRENGVATDIRPVFKVSVGGVNPRVVAQVGERRPSGAVALAIVMSLEGRTCFVAVGRDVLETIRDVGTFDVREERSR